MSTLPTCRELIDFLDDYAEDRLDPAARADFERHLALCSACRDYLKTYRDTIALARLSAVDDTPPAPPPPDLVKAIMNALERP